MVLKISELLDKVEGFENLTQKEQVKLMSFFFCVEHQVDSFLPSQIRSCFENESLRVPANVNNEVKKLTDEKPPTFVKKGSGYTFERNARKSLESVYLGSTHKQIISTTLRDLIPKLKSKEQQSFLEEAISCFEIKSFRAAIVMTWLLTMDTIYEFVLANKLSEFNNAIQAHGKYKKIVVSTKDNFSDIKESDFIELLRVAKIVSNDTRKILDEKLDFRNTCAHPNTVVIKETKAISFIEDIIENVVVKF
ncbi:hypothetical protein [Foetidibacter luteolus]|uniref:hypothetical protein n=1 Tax=Foetidibacter luteolus TaxID=2608880 RepID=UPI00129B62E4|nr:hypothetical protein [Foetidibacter luteolus]